jgi:hypothetical protein
METMSHRTAGGRHQKNKQETDASLRSLSQNDRFWAMLTDLSEQLQWPVDGELQWLSKEDWKVIISAGLKRHQRIAKGIEGGFVMLGEHTSQMKMKDFADMITLMFAFGALHDIKWTDPTVVPTEAYVA